MSQKNTDVAEVEQERALVSSRVDKVPFQISLFGIGGENEFTPYSNLFKLYDIVPHYVRQEKQLVVPLDKASENNRIRIQRFQDGMESWELSATPALIKDSSGKEIFRYPGAREETVMGGLIKMSMREPVMLGSKLGTPFFLRDLQREISDEGKQRLNLDQIKEALKVLKNAQYELVCLREDGKKQRWEYSQITEVLSSEDADNPLDDGDERFFAVFNLLLTNQVNNLEFRLFNYFRFKAFTAPFSPVMFKHLTLNFRNAGPGTHFDVWVNYMRRISGFTYDDDDMSIDTRRKPMITCLKELVKKGVIDRYEVVDTAKRRVSGKKRSRLKTVDECYRLYPSEAFIKDQKKASGVLNEIKMRYGLAHEQGFSDLDANDPRLQSIMDIPSDHINKMIQTERALAGKDIPPAKELDIEEPEN